MTLRQFTDLKDGFQTRAVVKGLAEKGSQATVQVIDLLLKDLIVIQELFALGVQTVVASLSKDLDVLQELLVYLLHLYAQHPPLHASHLCLLQLAEFYGGLKESLQEKKKKSNKNMSFIYRWSLEPNFIELLSREFC